MLMTWPEPVTQEGWVTTLVRGLKRRLAQKLGRNDAFTLWMDHELYLQRSQFELLKNPYVIYDGASPYFVEQKG